MDVKVTETKTNQLLNREELKFEVNFEKTTPSNQELAQSIASKQGKTPELVVVKHIYTDFGSKKADVTAYIYNSVEDLKKTEPKKKAKKGKEGEAKPEQPAPAPKPEEKKPEAPKGEKKEEVKEEKKEEKKQEPKKEEKPVKEEKKEEKKEAPKKEEKPEEKK